MRPWAALMCLARWAGIENLRSHFGQLSNLLDIMELQFGILAVGSVEAWKGRSKGHGMGRHLKPVGSPNPKRTAGRAVGRRRSMRRAQQQGIPTAYVDGRVFYVDFGRRAFRSADGAFDWVDIRLPLAPHAVLLTSPTLL